MDEEKKTPLSLEEFDAELKKLGAEVPKREEKKTDQPETETEKETVTARTDGISVKETETEENPVPEKEDGLSFEESLLPDKIKKKLIRARAQDRKEQERREKREKNREKTQEAVKRFLNPVREKADIRVTGTVSLILFFLGLILFIRLICRAVLLSGQSEAVSLFSGYGILLIFVAGLILAVSGQRRTGIKSRLNAAATGCHTVMILMMVIIYLMGTVS